MKRLIFVVLILSLVPFSFAELYADLDIYVDESGIVSIEGLSNDDLIKPGVYDDLTSKQDGYWLLNITSKDVFESYVFDLNLPENSVVNYIGVYDISSFEDNSGLRVKGIVEDKPFKVIVQYRIKNSITDFRWEYLILSLVFLIVGLVYGFYSKKINLIKTKIETVKEYDPDMFTPREFQVIKLLQKNKGHMSQAELQKETNLPKASLSRNIASLVRKEIIVKFKTGMTNMVKLK